MEDPTCSWFVESLSGCGRGDWKFTEPRYATAGCHAVQQGDRCGTFPLIAPENTTEFSPPNGGGGK